MVFKAGAKTTVTGCTDLGKKLVHPSAVRVTVINWGESKIDIPLEGLSSIILTKKGGKKVTALAWRHRQRSPIGSGYTTAFVSEFTGELIVTIDREDCCDFVFLFPKAEVGDVVTFGGFDRIKIAD